MTINLKYYVGWTAQNRLGEIGIIERGNSFTYPFIFRFPDSRYNSLTDNGKFLLSDNNSMYDVIAIRKENGEIFQYCNNQSFIASYTIDESDLDYDENDLGYAYLDPDSITPMFGTTVPENVTILASNITIEIFDTILEAMSIYMEVISNNLRENK